MEQQAQDRIHRLGQYKPIHVTRFVISGSIEERILKLQVTPDLSTAAYTIRHQWVQCVALLVC